MHIAPFYIHIQVTSNKCFEVVSNKMCLCTNLNVWCQHVLCWTRIHTRGASLQYNIYKYALCIPIFRLKHRYHFGEKENCYMCFTLELLDIDIVRYFKNWRNKLVVQRISRYEMTRHVIFLRSYSSNMSIVFLVMEYGKLKISLIMYFDWHIWVYIFIYMCILLHMENNVL